MNEWLSLWPLPALIQTLATETLCSEVSYQGVNPIRFDVERTQ
jgi:hypothetical protein